MPFRLRNAFVLLALTSSTLAQSGVFNILSFNVAGLPKILEGNGVGDKKANTLLMSTAFATGRYDLIHVQEDFNYHDEVVKNDNHPYRTKSSGGVPFGSGLNTLSNYNWSEYKRITWDDCSNNSKEDCLTPKGFTFMRWNPAPGLYIDVYNVHADAGTTDGDYKSRASNINQVANYISANSQGHPVIVFGDTNTLYSRPNDNIRSILAQNGLSDAWVQVARGGSVPAAGVEYPKCTDGVVPQDTVCETLDKVLFRGTKVVSLSPTTFVYETARFLTPAGAALSDHNPVRVDFSWSLSSSYQLSTLYGGTGGTTFSDLDYVSTTPSISSITLRGDSRLDAISLSFTSGITSSHGGTGGIASSINLSPGEYIARVTQCTSEHKDKLSNFYVQIYTSAGQVVTAGTYTGSCANTSAPEGWVIVGSRGKAGSEVDQLGWIIARQS